jgi:hypothetical protein
MRKSGANRPEDLEIIKDGKKKKTKKENNNTLGNELVLPDPNFPYKPEKIVTLKAYGSTKSTNTRIDLAPLGKRNQTQTVSY